MVDGRQNRISGVTLEHRGESVVQVTEGPGSGSRVGRRHLASEGHSVNAPSPMVFDDEGAHVYERVHTTLVGPRKFGRSSVDVRGSASQGILRHSACDGDVDVHGPFAARDVHDQVHARIGPAGVCQGQYHLSVH